MRAAVALHAAIVGAASACRRAGSRAWLLLGLLLAAASLPAHEVRPAYLELREVAPDEYAVLWKTPMAGELRLSLTPEFSGESRALTPVRVRTPPGAAVAEWTLSAPGLRGQSVRIRGLEATLTDAMVRVEFLDGSSWTQRLNARSPEAEIPRRPSASSVASVYGKLGIEHILSGVDHLLFVLALMFLVRGGWRLVQTVTAFTLAHSITLALATVGAVSLPGPPVEALIALSIAFVAAEITRAANRDTNVVVVHSLAERAPWLLAFAFGLLHGLGFAGALSEMGLPQGRIPLALLFFNLGVEAGQLLFIGCVLGAARLLRQLVRRLPRWSLHAPPYAIGSIAMFWVFQRIANF